MDILETINVQGHELDIYGTKEEPLFLAVDVSKMIDYSVGHTAHMLNNVDPDEKILLSCRSTNASARGSASNSRNNSASISRGNPNKWFLTEYGLYEVLMQSRKPIARRFKSSVKNILRDLRMRGEGGFEDWMNGPDPLVDEWENMCRQREESGDEDITFEDFLIMYKGYTDDML